MQQKERKEESQDTKEFIAEEKQRVKKKVHAKRKKMWLCYLLNIGERFAVKNLGNMLGIGLNVLMFSVRVWLLHECEDLALYD